MNALHSQILFKGLIYAGYKYRKDFSDSRKDGQKVGEMVKKH